MFSETLPELSASAWQQLEDVREIDRILYVAHASALANEVVVASVWTEGGDRLRGLALAIVVEHRGERWLSLTRGFEISKSILVARDDSAAEVTDEVFAALREHARRAGFRRLVLAPVEVDRADVLASAERAGFRLINATGYELHLPPTSTYESFVASLNSHQRANLRRDLRPLTNGTFECVEESPPTNETLERSWPLYVALMSRKGSPLAYRGNFLVELARRAPPDALSFVRCTLDQRLVAFIIGVHEADWSLPMSAVAWDIEVPLFQAIAAFWLRIAIDRGTRNVFLSQYNDAWKRRLTATPINYRFGFLMP